MLKEYYEMLLIQNGKDIKSSTPSTIFNIFVLNIDILKSVLNITDFCNPLRSTVYGNNT
jgi:hypothetical protein